MQRNYTRTKGANPNQNMRRNVIILAIAIAAGTTVALLIGFWPSITASQQQKQYMTTTEANAFLTANWPYANAIPPQGVGMIVTYTSRMPVSTFVTDTNVLCELAYGTLAQTMLDSVSWKNIGLVPGICIIFKQADLIIAGNGPSTRVTTTGGYVIIAFKTGVFSGSYGAPNIAIIPLPVVNQAALISDGYIFITV